MLLNSFDEISTMRENAHILLEMFRDMQSMVLPGTYLDELEARAVAVLQKRGAGSSFLEDGIFGHVIAASVNEQAAWGVPDHRQLKEQDMITISAGVYKNGLHCALTQTYAVGPVAAETRKLIDDTLESLVEGLAVVHAGVRVSDISHAIQTYALSHGYGVPTGYAGHGIGKHFQEPPAIRFYGLKGRGETLKEGQLLSVETMLIQGSGQTYTRPPSMTICAGGNVCHFGHTVIVARDGLEILTRLYD